MQKSEKNATTTTTNAQPRFLAFVVQKSFKSTRQKLFRSKKHNNNIKGSNEVDYFKRSRRRMRKSELFNKTRNNAKLLNYVKKHNTLTNKEKY